MPDVIDFSSAVKGLVGRKRRNGGGDRADLAALVPFSHRRVLDRERVEIVVVPIDRELWELVRVCAALDGWQDPRDGIEPWLLSACEDALAALGDSAGPLLPGVADRIGERLFPEE